MEGSDRPRGQVLAVVLVCLLSGVIAGFVIVALVSRGGVTDDEPGDHDSTADDRPVEWQRVTSSSGRYSVELPGEPVDDVGAIALGVDRTVPVATRHTTTADGTTATVAELDYSAVLADEPFDLRLGAANAVSRAGGSLDRYEEVASPLGPAASFGGSGEGVEVQGFLVANGGQVVLLLVTAPVGSGAAAAGVVRMASTLQAA